MKRAFRYTLNEIFLQEHVLLMQDCKIVQKGSGSLSVRTCGTREESSPHQASSQTRKVGQHLLISLQIPSSHLYIFYHSCDTQFTVLEASEAQVLFYFLPKKQG